MAAAPPDAAERAGSQHRAADITAVIVNWQRPEATIGCARRLLDWRRLAARVVVVDNGSGSEVVAHLERRLPGATMLASPRNLGFGGANNLALERLETEFVLLLNNDATIDEASAGHLMEFLRREPAAGLAGPVLEASRPPHRVLAAGGRDILRFGRTHCSFDERQAELDAGDPFAVAYVPGTAVLARTELLRRLGGFDESYFFSGEMADLAIRAAAVGEGSFVVPAARARHDLAVAAQLRDSLYTYFSLRNRFLFARRHALRPALAMLRWTIRGVGACLASVARGRIARARCQALALADGLAGRFGPANERVPQ